MLARRILHSPFGAVLRAIRENTARVEMLGHSVPLYKLAVFVFAALYAGLAGGLLGVFQSYMPPDAFTLDTSGQLVVQTVIGGVGTLIGPTVGAAVWLYLRDNLQMIPGIGALWKLILGLIFVALVIGLKRGICGEIIALFGRRAAGGGERRTGERPRRRGAAAGARAADARPAGARLARGAGAAGDQPVETLRRPARGGRRLLQRAYRLDPCGDRPQRGG